MSSVLADLALYQNPNLVNAALKILLEQYLERETI
jgi:hypothetical protein